MEKNEFIERINNEYESFKRDLLNKTKEEIFDSSYEIEFKTNMREYLLNEDNETSDDIIKNLFEIDGSILDALFDIYLHCDTYYTFNDIGEEVIDYYEENFEDVEID